MKMLLLTAFIMIAMPAFADDDSQNAAATRDAELNQRVDSWKAQQEAETTASRREDREVYREKDAAMNDRLDRSVDRILNAR